MNNKWKENLIEWLREIEERDYPWSMNGYETHKLSAAGLYCKLAKIYEINLEERTECLKTYRATKT